MGTRIAARPTDAGWAQLAEGRWTTALRCFERAVAETPSPRAFEGLSWAAWWLDDETLVFHAREEAYAGYRERADRVGAARMAIWLACDELDFRGGVAPANGWLARARRLLDGPAEVAEHGWLAFFEGYLAHAGGDAALARRRGQEAAALGHRLELADVEMLGLALEGAVRVREADVETGMGRLDEACALALTRDVAIPISGAWTCCFLVSSCAAVRDFERAAEWCGRIAAFAERYSSRYMLAFCRAEIGAVHAWRGDWAQAERVLQEAVADFASSRPAMVGAPLVGVAELRRRQGRRDDAVRALEDAGPSAAERLSRARLALDEGDARRALELAQRVLRQAGDGARLDHLPALELLVRAHLAAGDAGAAATAVAALREVAALAATPAARAGADAARGALAAAQGDHDRARTLLEDALDRFEACGAPYEAARVRLELAASLRALGRGDDAAREAAAALSVLEALGAQADVARARALAPGPAAAAPGDASPLTPREHEVLRLVADGLTNREIAERLIVSEHTVHRHVANLLRKLGVGSRAAAAAQGLRAGLLRDESR